MSIVTYVPPLCAALGDYVVHLDDLPTPEHAHSFLAGRLYAIPAPAKYAPLVSVDTAGGKNVLVTSAPLAPDGTTKFAQRVAAVPAVARPEIVREIAEIVARIADSPFYAQGVPGAAAWNERARRLVAFVDAPPPPEQPLQAYAKTLVAASPLLPLVRRLAAPLPPPVDVRPGVGFQTLDERWRLVCVRINDMIATARRIQ